MKDVSPTLKILFVHLADPKLGKSEIEKDITELWNLVQSLGNTAPTDLFVQKEYPHKATYIGTGKAKEIGEYLTTHPIDVIIINGNLNQIQKFNLTRMYWGIQPTIEVWDRIDLILSIFAKHAHTKEAVLQIKLARMRHMGPRMYGLGLELSQQGGGIGTRGIGETNVELMKRHWKREIKRVSDELDAIVDTRKKQMELRKNKGLVTISLVGYTNAGKTSLFNALTRKKKLVEDALFATLDSTIGEVYIPTLSRKVLVSDTIGFIADLPPDLISAFKSTLLESIHADVILHVIDASDPDIRQKIHVVMDILDTLHIEEEKIIFLFNKTDRLKDIDNKIFESLAYPYPYGFISAATKEGIKEFQETLLPQHIQKQS